MRMGPNVEGGEAMSLRPFVQARRLCALASLMVSILAPAGVSAQTLQVLDDIPGSFIDVSGSTPLVFGIVDEIGVLSSIGNFVFPSGIFVIGNNGGVAFGTLPSSDLSSINQPLPSVDAYGGGQAILAYWDDFDDKDGDVFFSEQAGRAIVQWHNRRLSANPASTAKFQLQIIQDPGPSGVVAQLIFSDIEQTGVAGGSSATIGYQDGGAGFGTAQWSFDAPGAVSNGTVLSLIVTGPSQVPAASGWGLVVASLALLTVGTLGVRKSLGLRFSN